MLIETFSERAAEYVRLAERSRSENDRKFFLTMARAWRGFCDEPELERDPAARMH